MPDDLDLHRQFDPPFDSFDNSMLGAEFAAELKTVSALWFACGYRPGIAAYLNFFLLRDFNTIHDAKFPARFASFRSMANSFYQTDLFVRAVTDSGANPTGGLSSAKVRAMLSAIMRRHQVLSIPPWMMTYFGFSLLEAVERQCAPINEQQKRWHLAYMAKTYRIMGMAFSTDRRAMTQFARSIERAGAGVSTGAERHVGHILALGEMIGVPSHFDAISPMLPDHTRAILEQIHARVRPGVVRRQGARLLGRLLMKRAVGAPRVAVPVTD